MRKVLTVAFFFSLTTVAQCAVIGYHMEEFVDKYGRQFERLVYERDDKPVEVPPLKNENVDLNDLRLKEINKDHIKLYDTKKMKTYTIDKSGTNCR